MEDRLGAFAGLLRGRAVELGLVAEGDRKRIRERHIDDSLRAEPLISPGEAVWDLGSGAGLPGVPLAITLPDAWFVLLEPRTKAVAFLELAIERLGLTNAEVIQGRVEEANLGADVATTRAFGPIERSWEAACRVLRPGGRLIYFAGGSFDLARARDLKDPEHPAGVEAVDSSAPLVIMTRVDDIRPDQARRGTSTAG